MSLPSGCVSKTTYEALMSLRHTNSYEVQLCRILKSGKIGKPQIYDRFGCEKNAEDVIKRLERLNPGTKWIEFKG